MKTQPETLEFLSISERYFERIAHYKDRQPIWIKLYLDLFDDFQFCSLPDQAKWHFIALMMLAAKLNNRLPNNLHFLHQKLSATSEIDIEILLEKKFLVCYKPRRIKSLVASKTLAKRKQNASLEREEEKDKDKEEEKKTHTPRAREDELFVDVVTISEIQSDEIYKNLDVHLEHQKLLRHDAVERVTLKRFLTWLNSGLDYQIEKNRKSKQTRQQEKREWTDPQTQERFEQQIKARMGVRDEQ